jgi:hypothetical protein
MAALLWFSTKAYPLTPTLLQSGCRDLTIEKIRYVTAWKVAGWNTPGQAAHRLQPAVPTDPGVRRTRTPVEKEATFTTYSNTVPRVRYNLNWLVT